MMSSKSKSKSLISSSIFPFLLLVSLAAVGLIPAGVDAKEDEDEDLSEASKGKGHSRRLVVGIGVCFVVVVCVVMVVYYMYKRWQRKKREQKQAQLMKLFEPDDQLEEELAIEEGGEITRARGGLIL